ncbi:sulfite exporter TauE/SafE family protein [Dokdonella sp.]|uniref:sulfite exporter TauE/SafE family protein n=1 Tax=Dokdonella sp. TaxID=2291710 RepID=UPI001B03F252|nr:sulfite exporter TauE/SafE family protein [Dokdonella sp.]MBO9663017.1 sulfite exporter TauE/SafE family protein [Dokdonella sp.]
MSGGLTLGAALLLGLAASGHCLVMCGGISAALGIATAKRADGRPHPMLLLGYQLGRIVSYTLAGLVIGGVLGGLFGLLDLDAVRATLRALGAAALLLGALVAFGRVRDPGFGIGRRLWSKLAPLGRRLLPVTNLPRAFAFGLVWGWMPCGFVYTVLLIAATRLDALDAAATMAAFGLGTAPALFAGSLGAQRLAGWAGRPGARRAAGCVLLASAALTLAGPWLPGAHWMHAWLPFDCAHGSS